MGLTVHLELEFDTCGVEPNPWWRPFAWCRTYDNENGFWQRVVRVGVLGLHLGGSIAQIPMEVLDPKE